MSQSSELLRAISLRMLQLILPDPQPGKGLLAQRAILSQDSKVESGGNHLMASSTFCMCAHLCACASTTQITCNAQIYNIQHATFAIYYIHTYLIYHTYIDTMYITHILYTTHAHQYTPQHNIYTIHASPKVPHTQTDQ